MVLVMVNIPKVKAMSKAVNSVGEHYPVEGYFFKHYNRQLAVWEICIRMI